MSLFPPLIFWQRFVGAVWDHPSVHIPEHLDTGGDSWLEQARWNARILAKVINNSLAEFSLLGGRNRPMSQGLPFLLGRTAASLPFLSLSFGLLGRDLLCSSLECWVPTLWMAWAAISWGCQQEPSWLRHLHKQQKTQRQFMSKTSSVSLVLFGNGFGTENDWNNATEMSIEARYSCVYTRASVSMEMSENIIFRAQIASIELTK